MYSICRFLTLLFVCSLASIWAQSVAGLAGIAGVVRDGSGAAVPGANVIVANESKGIRRALTTNESGVFTAPALVASPGYSVTVNKDGFTAYEAKNITLNVGQQVDLSVALTVASSATSIQVVAEIPIVESTKTGVSQVVDSKQIQNLPINGRRVDSFVLLTPAVVSDGTFGLVSFRGIAGGNAFLTDGNDTTNQFYNENAGRTRISTQISQDAVQEFEVKSSGYSAEFGRASGGVINTVTRSGTNDLHGTGYWFFRNRTLNATDRYSTFNAPEVRHQTGASIGGPIKKDKIFYFFNAETTRRNFPIIASMTRPPLFNSNGTFTANATTGCTASAAQCQAARDFFGRQFGTLPRVANSELAFGKVDFRPTEKNSISLSFNYLRWISPLGIQTQAVLNNGQGVGNNADSTVRTRYGRAAWTYIPSFNKVNELRFGWFKDRLFDGFSDSLIPAQTGRVGITVEGQANVGVSTDYPRLNPSENRYQIADTFSWNLGKHDLKFGFDFVNTRDVLVVLRNEFGSYSYANFTNFALDLTGNTTGAKRWQSFSQAFGEPRLDFSTKDYNFFVQDQWRARKGLTINYGVRYEYTDLPKPTTVNARYPQTGRIPEPKKNFAPRVGLAYSFNNDKTVIRAGYGLFYARFQGGLLSNFLQLNGQTQRAISLNFAVPSDLAAGPVFPNRLGAIVGAPPRGSVDLQFAADDFRNPYTQQWDFGIEHQLTRRIGLTVSYLGSRGVQLTTTRDVNIGAPGPEVTYRIFDASNNQTGTYTTPTFRLANRVDGDWRRLVMVDNGGRSWYDAMVVQVKMREWKSFQGSVAYTWSHAIDFNQGGGNNNIFFNGVSSLFNGDYRQDKSSSSLDQRHRFVFNSVYAPTFWKRDGWAAKYLVNNWQLSQITTLASTQPQTPTIRVVGAPFTGAAFNTSLNGFGGSSRVPFLPAASLPIDQIYRVDARLTKVLPISERYQLHLNFEAFNVFNRISDTGVNGEAYSASGGILRPTPGLGAGSASQGFPDGTNARRAQVSLRFIF